jgi:hypothetical protein
MGLGYYRQASGDRGYLAQDFGAGDHAPVIVENESVRTGSDLVDLYTYSSDDRAGFTGMGPATQMMISNNPCFDGAEWQPYTAERSWRLAPGSGWRTVFVKTRDAVGRTSVGRDTIYLGEKAPWDELGLHLASPSTARVTIPLLDGGGRPYVQLSQNWFADDRNETFELLFGSGERVSDPAARGGTAFRLRPADVESSAWVWTTSFFKATPFTAYVRLKVSDNGSSEEVARFAVRAGGTEYGPLRLKGTDFAAPGAHQEFPLPFTFHDNPDDGFLIFQFWRSGSATVTVDGVTIFTEPKPVESPFEWKVPGGTYRGGGIRVRYTDGAGSFSPMKEVDLNPPRLAVSPPGLHFLAEKNGIPPSAQRVQVVQGGCGTFDWTATEDGEWLETRQVGDAVEARVDAAGLEVGSREAVIAVDGGSGVVDSPVEIPVTLRVVERVHRVLLPVTLRK